MTEPNPPRATRKWLGFSKRALIVHGVLALITLGFWLLVPAAIYTWRRGGGAKKLSYGLWSVVGLIAAGLIYGLSVDGGAEQTAAPAETQPAATTEQEKPAPAITEAATTERAQSPATTATEPPDTGRMDDSEYGNFTRVIGDVDEELSEYGTGLQKCGVLLQALELAAASECVGDAYKGVGDNMLAAYGTAESLEGDVAKGCLKALRLYRQRLDVFYGWHERTQDAGENLQFDEFSTLASLSPSMTKRYAQARDWAVRDCEPR